MMLFSQLYDKSLPVNELYVILFFYKHFRWRNKENALDKLESIQWSPPCFLRMVISIPSFQITPAATQIVVFRPVFTLLL